MSISRTVVVLVALASTLAPAAEQRTVDEAVGLKVLTFQEQVTDLKEKVALSKARLRELERIARGGGESAAAELVIVHHNQVGFGYALESAAYALDGVALWARAGESVDAQQIEIFRGRLAPGPHQISVQMLYRGTGMTFFPYHEGYRFKLRSSQTLQLEPAQALTLDVIGSSRLDLMAAPEGRLGIQFEVHREEPRR